MDFDKPILTAISTNLKTSFWRPLLFIFILLTILSLQISTDTFFPIRSFFSSSFSDGAASSPDPISCSGFFGSVPARKVVMSVKDFGGIGDGKTSNTEAFRRAVRYMQRFGDKGGSQLNVPKGVWLTGSFNLTSNFTLFLEEGAVILGSQVIIKSNLLNSLFK